MWLEGREYNNLTSAKMLVWLFCFSLQAQNKIRPDFSNIWWDFKLPGKDWLKYKTLVNFHIF